MPSDHLFLCCPLLRPPSIFPSIRVFSNESVLCIRWPKYCSFSFSISPSNEYSGLISFMIDWFSPRDSQESSPPPQFQTINSSALSFLYGPTLTTTHDYWKTIALTRWTFVGKVMFLLFNMLTSFSSKEQTSFNFLAAVTICSDFGAQENKECHCFPIYLP